jgi:hypothetical protein
MRYKLTAETYPALKQADTQQALFMLSIYQRVDCHSMAMSSVFGAHFKAKLSRSTLAYLLPSKIYMVEAIPCIDICRLLLTSSSNLLLLISFDMLFELPIISSRFLMMNTMKIEPGAFLVYTTTFLHNSETLGESKAWRRSRQSSTLQNTSPSAGSFRKVGGKALTRAFDPVAEVGRAVGMGSPSGRRGAMATVKHQEYLAQSLFRK